MPLERTHRHAYADAQAHILMHEQKQLQETKCKWANGLHVPGLKTDSYVRCDRFMVYS